jgi:16S rRNA (cytosine1402-N4)-methyltransferase
MKQEVVDALAPQAGGVYVDATLGGGGHTEALLQACDGAHGIAFARDPNAIAAGRARLERFGDRVTFVRSAFSNLVAELSARGVRHVDGLCADLGVSSPQIDEAERGMSFRMKGPLDMRMDPDSGETALEWIARSDENEIADAIYRYGEERRSRRIARSIRRAFSQNELETTLDLRRAVVRAVGPARIGGVDPATRTFQAIRIVVNGELDELESLLGALPKVLKRGASAAILSFHSLEDRLVKRAFVNRDTWSPHFKKPRMATDDEATLNPRARSAKMRAATLLGREA